MATPEEEIKGLLDEQAKTFEEFKREVKGHVDQIDGQVKTNALTKDKLDKMEADFADVEEKLGKANEAIKEREDKAEAQEKYLKELEAKVNRPGGGTKVNPENYEHKALFEAACLDDAPERKTAYDKYLRAPGSLTPEERKVLTIADATTGGYLAPPEYVNEIIKRMRETTPVMQIAKVMNTGSNTVNIPRRNGTVTAVRRGESEAKTATTGLTFTMEQVQLTELYCYDDISQQNLDDSMFDLEAELREEFTDAFRAKIGAEFVTGSGPLQMEGITVNSTLTAAATDSGHATTIQPGTLLTFLENGVEPQFRPNRQLLFNQGTLAAIRILTDTQGGFHWSPGFGATPNTLAGVAYTICQDMPDVGANTYPIGLGDWRKGYAYVQRLAIAMRRIDDTVTDAAGTTRISGTMRANGIITLTDAIQLYKISA